MIASVPTGPVPERLDRFLRGAHPAVVATVLSDGAPVSVATWYLWQGDRFMISMEAGRLRARTLAHDPRVALTVLGEDWYDSVSLRGRVVELRRDPDRTDLDAISHHYRGVPYPRDTPFDALTAIVAVDSWHEFVSATRT
jgi:PPOX class probable F420-dependent enzyme